MNEGNPIPTANPVAIANAVSTHAAATTGVHGAGSNNVANTGANTFTGAQLIRAAATQDAIEIIGRAGGTSSYKATITPLALSASRTWSLPDRSDTFAGLKSNTFTETQILGTDPGGSELLRVGGSIRTSSTVRANLMELAGTNAALDIYISSGNTGSPAVYLRKDSRYDGIVSTTSGIEFRYDYTGTLTKMVLSAQQLEVFGSVKSSGGFFKGVNEAVYANDSRLSDARTPVAHNQAWSTITSTPTTRSGYGITDAASTGANTFTESQVIGTDPGGSELLRVGGSVNVASGQGYKVAGTKVVGGQASAIADVSTADATDLTSAVALANANKAKINAILAMLRTHGLIAT
jgi:hypothetical protein